MGRPQHFRRCVVIRVRHSWAGAAIAVPAIVAGDAQLSLLAKAIRHEGLKIRRRQPGSRRIAAC